LFPEAGEDLLAVKTDDPNISYKPDKRSKIPAGDNELQTVSLNDKKLRILEQSFKEDPSETISVLLPRKKEKDCDESNLQVLTSEQQQQQQQQQQQLNGSIKAAEENLKDDEPGGRLTEILEMKFSTFLFPRPCRIYED